MTRTHDAHGHVVVAVDGSDEGYAAGLYAAKRAATIDAPLDVIHVFPAYLPVGPFYPVGPLVMPTEEFQRYGKTVLERALELVRDSVPASLPICTDLLTGGRVHRITEYAEHARLLVLGRREHSRLDQVWTGGTIAGVASQAPCPVVVAPTGWAPDSPKRIVVGFKAPHHALELFATAFSAAAEAETEVVVLHAWKLPNAYEEIIAHRVADASVNGEQKELIWQMLEDVRDAYPTVRVRIEVTHETPVRALVRASDGAERLVIGRPAHGGLVHHLGRTARGVLRESRCPVEVVPPEKSSELPLSPVALEQGGDLVR